MLERLMEQIKSALPGMVAVYRFGSWGTPNERPDSDVDRAVLMTAPTPAVERWDLAQRLAAIAGRDVDLVDLRGASTVLAAQVVSSGERLYCANSGLCEEHNYQKLSLDIVRSILERNLGDFRRFARVAVEETNKGLSQ